MKISFMLNGEAVEFDVAPNESLFRMLRHNGVFGVKYGDDDGQSGADLVLLDGAPVVSSLLLAAQAQGHKIVTIEGIGGEQERGWRGSEPLHPLQTAFIETGAIQCGYCTPGMILAAKALLDRNPEPDRKRGPRRAGGRAVPLHGLRQARRSGVTRGGGHARRGCPAD